MSVFLGLGQNILTNSFGTLLSGGAPPIMILPAGLGTSFGQPDGIVLYDIEVPEKIEFGGSQSLVVHKMPGGMRVIDAMGRDDMDISWSGILEGPTATARALTFDAMRVSGGQWNLSWDVLSWTVVLKDFSAQYVHRNWIPYNVKFIVVKDNSANFAPSAQSTQSSVNNDVATATGAPTP